MESQPDAGSYTVDITARKKNRYCKGRMARSAEMPGMFAPFRMNPHEIIPSIIPNYFPIS
ncbi:MAG: hypothetical protein OCD02_10205 [Spirochaetaceae bacterium]